MCCPRKENWWCSGKLRLSCVTFGFDSRVVSAIGDDKLGNEILENFDGKNLKYQIEKVPYPTRNRTGGTGP